MAARDDVLVVEDDPDMVEVMLLVLEGAGYAARAAPDGQRALEAVAARLPALVLLDMIMPVMDGWAFARALHQRWGDAVPVVVVTAAEHAGFRGQEVGADEVLSKPFEIADLLRIVSRYVPASGRAAPTKRP